ncbi:MAG: excinuclease ABC subunit C [Candidatus Omnitrophica bacterium CG11_big_fil_rev_8_21_14_0_20_45_26]|uniref:Excinuclease ABC subunit C n=1 Tax=Candidatus Abzuiibacterium crystallinum TaxID=1974748 RepID=A0A2H0LSS4_9BACT|nr:MAG: excinuclease ABC subunit C [Candidatus Omnitrophica bacterium CG11_big_fil_rev_8_21_14_0_20_45_26]PIW64528.1 MAG: excinuclease ABC subunit C [Candidatus Omnitrophica bacterium CG12_big_fil_rev_8_21_14_0_65_45_16]
MRDNCKEGYVYILTNRNNKVLYTGVTSNLIKRVSEHRSDVVAGFSKKYRTHKLIYYELCGSIESAILREKQIKGGSRQKKINLINELNPEWKRSVRSYYCLRLLRSLRSLAMTE